MRIYMNYFTKKINVCSIALRKRERRRKRKRKIIKSRNCKKNCITISNFW